MDLSAYTNVFCDSLQALNWARDHGLSKDALVRTSAPALLWDQDPNIVPVEKRWTVDEMGQFQQTIQKHTEDIFDAVLAVADIEREKAICVAQTALMFQRTLYKAACLEEEDFTDSRLIIQVVGEGGPAGNNMNTPWDRLLATSEQSSVATYTLRGDEWTQLSTQGVTWWKRFRVAGVETVTFRLAMKVMTVLPDWLFRKEILIPNENELVIESAASLALRGVKLTKLMPASTVKETAQRQDDSPILDKVLPVIKARVIEWVTPSAISSVMECFQEQLQKQLDQFNRLAEQWQKSLDITTVNKQAVLMNSPGNIKGQTLAYVCRTHGIPLIAAQHGVTVEISKLHGEVSCGFDNSVSDCVLAYNNKVVDIENNSHFAKSKQVVVGASSRHIRMKNANHFDSTVPPIVYISTNLYRGNMGAFVTFQTDYSRARTEQKLVLDVFSKIPFKVRYKTYPDDNRRYADQDPVLMDIESADNIELFSNKVDMRYLLSSHRILVTSSATSTLGWPVMTGKPVVFINWKNNSPLTEEAHASLSQGLFLFDYDEPEFYDRLREFLSQPIDEIERLWEQKSEARKAMISEFFSAYPSGAGARAARMILQEYL